MKVSSEIITIKYQTAKEYCSCCSREFDIPEFGEVREFDVTLKSFFEWADWSSEYEVDDEDVAETVREYLFDTISFYALSGTEILKICEGEEWKVIDLVIEAISNKR